MAVLLFRYGATRARLSQLPILLTRAGTAALEAYFAAPCQVGRADAQNRARNWGAPQAPTSGIVDKLNHHLLEIEDRKPRDNRGSLSNCQCMDMDDDACYRAIETRDRRFDGRLFVAVTSTGIYCRPFCPAPTPKRKNARFFNTAAAAQEAGFRPCLRCRPETSPELAFWQGGSNTVSRALGLIEAGALNGANVEALATRLGLGERQLRRLFRQHLGASPISIAQTRRILLAKQLIQDTRLPMIEVAAAAGFGSTRRFNEIFQQLYKRPPKALRRAGVAQESVGTTGAVTVKLGYRPPYDWEAILSFLRARAIPGIEVVASGRYARTIAMGDERGVLVVEPVPGNCLKATVRFPNLKNLPAIIARVRRVFDLAADPLALALISARTLYWPRLSPLAPASEFLARGTDLNSLCAPFLGSKSRCRRRPGSPANWLRLMARKSPIPPLSTKG